MSRELLIGAAWLAATLVVYAAAKALHRRRPAWWSSPVVTTPLILLAALAVTGATYGQYIAGTGWLVRLLGPATVAFAVPIWEQRALIRRTWRILALAATAGSATSVAAAWALASALALPDALRLSLLPRSLSTPFAMIVSQEVGGVPELTAVFVILTGVFGAMVGEVLLLRPRFGSDLARGAAIGVGAHAIGTAQALQADAEAGAIAGVVMVLTGLANVLAAPLLAALI